MRVQELDELVKKQRDEGAEQNFRKMRWPCKSCMLSDDPDKREHYMKTLPDFNVRCPADFVNLLLPQGSWTRCSACKRATHGQAQAERGHEGREQGGLGKGFGKLGGKLGGNENNIPKEQRKEFGSLGKGFGKLGGNHNNEANSQRRLAAAQACEACAECGRMLPHAHYWPADWRHRTSKAIACKECRPSMPSARPRGGGVANQQRSAEAASKPITCKVCRRTLPRSHFRPGANGKFKLSKGLTCEECRAEGKLDRGGRKRLLSESEE